MPLVVRGWAASLRAIPHFGIETTQEGGVSKMQQYESLICLCGTGRWGLWLVTTCQVFDSVTPLMAPADDWQLCGSGVQHRNDRGQGSQGGVTRSRDTYWHLKGPTAIPFWSSTFFKAREGLHILTFFPLSRFLFRGFGPVFEKKSPSEVSIHNEETFLLCFPFVVFFLSLKMHKCSTETKKYQNRPS